MNEQQRTISATTIIVDVTLQNAEAIESLLDEANASEFTSHGPLPIESLVTMLLEDAALAFRRPSSWEGTGMLSMLRRHGNLQ